MGYYPFAYIESRYNGVYRDIGHGGAAGAQGVLPRYGRDRPRHDRMRLRYSLRYGRPARKACGSMRAHGLAKGVSRYKDCIMA